MDHTPRCAPSEQPPEKSSTSLRFRRMLGRAKKLLPPPPFGSLSIVAGCCLYLSILGEDIQAMAVGLTWIVAHIATHRASEGH